MSRYYNYFILFCLFLPPFFCIELSSTLIPVENIKVLQSAADVRLILEQLEAFVVAMQITLEKNRELWERMSHELCTIEEFYSEYEKIESCNEIFSKLLERVTLLREQSQSNSLRLGGIKSLFVKIIEEERKRGEILTNICELF